MRQSLVLLLLVTVTSACTRFFFYPLYKQVRTPEEIGLPYDNVWLETDDGVLLHGWYLPAQGRACATILFLHGNAQNVSTHIASVYWLPERGFNVFMIDYRGYGDSTGSPSLTGLQTDIDAAMRYLLTQGGGEGDGTIVFGQSLGGAAAVYYVAHSRYRSHIRALVVESSFSSYRDIAQEKLAGFWLTWPFQWLARWTVSDSYSPVAAVGRVTPIPLLLIHGDKDAIIPLEHSERLYDAAKSPKELWTVENAGHIGAFRSERWREELVSFLTKHACSRTLRQPGQQH